MASCRSLRVGLRCSKPHASRELCATPVVVLFSALSVWVLAGGGEAARSRILRRPLARCSVGGEAIEAMRRRPLP